jgi:hypothetical protein
MSELTLVDSIRILWLDGTGGAAILEIVEEGGLSTHRFVFATHALVELRRAIDV